MTWEFKINDRRLGPIIAAELDLEEVEQVMEEGPSYDSRNKWYKPTLIHTLLRRQNEMLYDMQFISYPSIIVNPADWKNIVDELAEDHGKRK